MARIAKTVLNPTGLFAWLLEREELRARQPDYVDPWAGTVVSYPRWRLEDLRAGRPVDVPTHVLPKWAKTLDMGGRAIVRADDSVETYTPDMAYWANDRGLLFGEGQAQSWARRHFDMFDMSWQPFAWKPARR